MIRNLSKTASVWQISATPLSFVGLIAVAFLAIGPGVVTAAPDDVLLEVDRATRIARAARSETAAAAPSLDSAIETAVSLRQQYRRTHDPRLTGQALTLLAPWIRDGNDSVDLNILYADLLQTTHRFDEARIVLERTARLAPSQSRIWHLLATIELVSGHYDAARDACARLLTLARPLVATGCAAQVAGVSGQANQARRILGETLERETGESATVRAWAHRVLADLAWRQAELVVAGREFAAAVALDPDDLSGRNEYAMFLALTGQNSAAIEIAGDEPSLALARAIALKQLGRDATQDTATLNEWFSAAARRGESGHAREQAWFELIVLENPDRALDLARKNWDEQREAIDAWLLARAARATQSTPSLAAVREWTVSTGLEDQRVNALLDPRR